MLSHERRVFALALAGGSPAVVLSLYLLWRSPSNALVQVTASAVVIAAWVYVAIRLRERVARPLQTIANLLEPVDSNSGLMRLNRLIYQNL